MLSLHTSYSVLYCSLPHLQSTLLGPTFRALSLHPHTIIIMQTVKNTIAENMGGISHSLAPEQHQFDIDKDVPSQKGKVALITGGSEGIGYAAGFVMLRAGLEKLFVLSLSKEIADGARKDISEKLGQEYVDRVVWFGCDMSDWAKVAETAKKVSEQTDRLDVLILNAARGIMTYQVDERGIDRHMSANHIGTDQTAT